MKTFNSIEKSYSKQRATAYIVYMMAGSYFYSQGTGQQFRNLYLHYAEMPRQKQYECESRVISAMEKLNRNFLKRISGLRSEVACKTCGDELLIEFRTGGFEGLHCRVQKTGAFELMPVWP